MAKTDIQILILEDDACFRGILENACADFGEIEIAQDMDTALSSLTNRYFSLLLLDWHLVRSHSSSFLSTLENFQPHALKVALFTVPDLSNVVEAVKSGASDVLWAGQPQEILKEKVGEVLSLLKTPDFSHSFVSKMAETLTEKAIIRKTSLFQARREFSKTFLQEALIGQNLRRSQLASLMDVSPRTLHRHLSS